jgi:DNA-binding Lrp family transcriptional regulator
MPATWTTPSRTPACTSDIATILALSRTLGIARNTVHARLRRLADDGLLRPFSHRLDLGALGYELVAFMTLSVSQASPGLVEGLLSLPEVISAHYTTGNADILVHVVAKSTRDLHRITNAILAIDGVVRTSTAIAARGDPLPAAGPAPRRGRRSLLAPDPRTAAPCRTFCGPAPTQVLKDHFSERSWLRAPVTPISAAAGRPRRTGLTRPLPVAADPARRCAPTSAR